MIDDELTPEERAALEALPRGREPSRLLEERTVTALRERGLLRTAGRSRASRFLRAGATAAAVALFLAGFAAGRSTAPDGAVSSPAGTRTNEGIGAADSTEKAGPNGSGDEPLRIVWL